MPRMHQKHNPRWLFSNYCCLRTVFLGSDCSSFRNGQFWKRLENIIQIRAAKGKWKLCRRVSGWNGAFTSKSGSKGYWYKDGKRVCICTIHRVSRKKNRIGNVLRYVYLGCIISDVLDQSMVQAVKNKAPVVGERSGIKPFRSVAGCVIEVRGNYRIKRIMHLGSWTPQMLYVNSYTNGLKGSLKND